MDFRTRLSESKRRIELDRTLQYRRSRIEFRSTRLWIERRRIEHYSTERYSRTIQCRCSSTDAAERYRIELSVKLCIVAVGLSFLESNSGSSVAGSNVTVQNDTDSNAAAASIQNRRTGSNMLQRRSGSIDRCGIDAAESGFLESNVTGLTLQNIAVSILQYQRTGSIDTVPLQQDRAF